MMTQDRTNLSRQARWILCENELLHIMSVAIGAVYLSVNDATKRLDLQAELTNAFDPEVLPDNGLRDVLLRQPKWEMDESQLLRAFELASGVKYATVAEGAARFRVYAWQVTQPSNTQRAGLRL